VFPWQSCNWMMAHKRHVANKKDAVIVFCLQRIFFCLQRSFFCLQLVSCGPSYNCGAGRSLQKLPHWVLVRAIALSVVCSPLINTLDVFRMDESKESVTDSEGGSISGSTIESKERLSEFEGRSTCGCTVEHNRKRGKQITGSKTVKSVMYNLIEVLRYCDNHTNKTKIVLYRLGRIIIELPLRISWTWTWCLHKGRWWKSTYFDD